MCPTGIEGVKDLDMVKLSGDWFMHRSLSYAENYMPTTCYHVKTEVNEDGTFKAVQEARYLGKEWVAQNIKGELTGDLLRTELFDGNLTTRMQILDTDYENYSISLECYDN